MSDHTPTPWKIAPETIALEGGAVQIISHEVYDRTVAHVTSSDEVPYGEDGPTAEDIANAERIVKCVNLHDKLLDTLKAASEWIDEQVGVRRIVIQERIQLAIAQAESGAA